MAVFKQSQSES